MDETYLERFVNMLQADLSSTKQDLLLMNYLLRRAHSASAYGLNRETLHKIVSIAEQIAGDAEEFVREYEKRVEVEEK